MSISIDKGQPHELSINEIQDNIIARMQQLNEIQVAINPKEPFTVEPFTVWCIDDDDLTRNMLKTLLGGAISRGLNFKAFDSIDSAVGTLDLAMNEFMAQGRKSRQTPNLVFLGTLLGGQTTSYDFILNAQLNRDVLEAMGGYPNMVINSSVGQTTAELNYSAILEKRQIVPDNLVVSSSLSAAVERYVRRGKEIKGNTFVTAMLEEIDNSLKLHITKLTTRE